MSFLIIKNPEIKKNKKNIIDPNHKKFKTIYC